MDFEQYNRAIALAAEAHSGQMRKASAVPYLSHPVAVAALIAEYGGDDQAQIAGLLHDVLEDAGPHWASRIAADFGPAVLALVESCTDGTPDARGQKAPWHERKTSYLIHLEEASDQSLLVSACDKLANLRSIRCDLERMGSSVFNRFKAGQAGTLWYYEALIAVYRKRDCPPVPALEREFRQVLNLAEPDLTQVIPFPPGDLGRQLSFLAELEKLKLVYRQNGLLDGSRQENSAEHSWHVALMAMVMSDLAPGQGIDLLKALKMLLIHDVVEIDAGDNFVFSPEEIQAVKTSEHRAAGRLFGLLPSKLAHEFGQLWQEFEARQSPEARYAAAMDAIQPLLNHLLTARPGDRYQPLPSSLIRDWKSHIRHCSPELWQLAQDLIAWSVEQGLYTPD